MTGTLQVSSKDGKYYIHLSWRQNGVRKQKCIGTGLYARDHTKRKAERMLQDVLHEWEQKISENTTEVLFSDYLATWLEETKHTLALSTYENYKTVINGVIRPYFKALNIKLMDLKPRDIQKFYNERMERSSVSGNTIRHYHAYLHKALAYAVRMGLRNDNPADRVELPRKEKHIANYLTAEQVKCLLLASEGTNVEAVVRLAIWFGLRRGEIIGLKWENIDLEEGTILVDEVVSRAGKLITKLPKTVTSIRKLPMTVEMSVYFTQLREKQQENQREAGKHYNIKHEDYVCVDSFGNRLKPEYITREIPKLCEACGLGKIRLHELRHTNISLLLSQGASMKEVQEWAGHSNYNTTANIYAHVRPDSKSKLAKAIQTATEINREK